MLVVNHYEKIFFSCLIRPASLKLHSDKMLRPNCLKTNHIDVSVDYCFQFVIDALPNLFLMTI